jgi:hypothetical protein
MDEADALHEWHHAWRCASADRGKNKSVDSTIKVEAVFLLGLFHLNQFSPF